MNKTLHQMAALALCAGLSLAAHAGEVVVIVNKANAQPVDAALIAKIYTGTAQSWPDGSSLTVYDQSDEAVRGQFAATIGRTPSNLKAAWAALMFAGKATPPKALRSDAEVKAAVAADKGAIGYVKTSAVDDSVKVVGPK